MCSVFVQYSGARPSWPGCELGKLHFLLGVGQNTHNCVQLMDRNTHKYQQILLIDGGWSEKGNRPAQ